MGKIVGIGSSNTDMVITGRRIPSAGETVSGGRFMMNPGGKGANQAVAVARLASKGWKCVFIGKVGDDLFGRSVGKRMKADWIVPHLAIDNREASGTALIMVDDKGQNVISVAPGANGTLSPGDIAPYLGEIERAAVLLMQLETPLDVVMRAAEVAHAAGVPVILNPAPARKLPRGLYPLIDWITPNETEAEALTGVKVVDAASAAEASKALRRRGVGHVIITMGSKGCWCGDCGRLFPAKKVKAVDCVAAGDTFNGALAVAIAEGMGCAEAVDFAQKASAIAVTRPGAQSSVPYRREIK